MLSVAASTRLIFLLTFLFQDKKVSGVWGKSPIIKYLKIKKYKCSYNFLVMY